MSTLSMQRKYQDDYRQQTKEDSPVCIYTRHCTTCGKWKTPIGGASKAIANSRRRAWSCAECNGNGGGHE